MQFICAQLRDTTVRMERIKSKPLGTIEAAALNGLTTVRNRLQKRLLSVKEYYRDAFECRQRYMADHSHNIENPSPGRAYMGYNPRSEVLAQIESSLPNLEEDTVLALQNILKKETKELPPSDRLVGIELECTGCSSGQLQEVIRSVQGSRNWHVVHDGSIPHVRAKCVHNRETKCIWCQLNKEECKCCRFHYTCSNRSCWTAPLENWRQYNYRCPYCQHPHDFSTRPPDQRCTCIDENHGPCPHNWTSYCSVDNTCGCPEWWTGGEVVSPPGKTEAFFSIAEKIFDGIVQRAKDNSSSHKHRDGDRATGFHVHVDASGLDRKQHAMVIVLWKMMLDDLQQQFPKILPKWRTENFTYCKINERFNPQTKLDAIYSANTGDRYRQINLDSLRKHGTLEFRVGYLPDTGEEVVAWAKACREIVDKVAFVEKEELATINTAEDATSVLSGIEITEWCEKHIPEQTVLKAFFKQFKTNVAYI